MIQQFGNALAFVLLAAALPPLILFISKFFRPHFPHAGKLLSYECGEEPVGSAYVMFNNRFYLVAIVFLVFDVEIALLFPVMTVFRDSIAEGYAGTVFSLAFIFLFILFIGLVYEWKKGDIDWIKDALIRRDQLQSEDRYKERLGAQNSLEENKVTEGNQS